MAEVINSVLNSIGGLLVCIGVFVVLVNIGALLKSMGNKM